VLDSARFKAALHLFPHFFRAGGWVPLAATHYNFIREIPMFASYEVRMSIGGWDDKWIYIVCKFITFPKKSKTIGNGTSSSSATAMNGDVSVSLHTPSSKEEIDSTPGTPANGLIVNGADGVPTSIQDEPLEEGAVLNTISISRICFKHKRLTVPPAVVLATNGFSCSPPESKASSSPQAYSRTNPPPFWGAVRPMISTRNLKDLTKLLKGGWRDVPEADRWWVSALGGEVEAQRKRALESLGAVRV